RAAGPASSARARSPGGWSTRASCPSTAWAATPTAALTTPCASSRASRWARPSPASTPGTLPRRTSAGGRWNCANCLGRFPAACNAIAYAHRRAVLHRDLKPDNVMLGAFGETLVVDWGLARTSADSEEAPAAGTLRLAGTLADSGLTRAGEVLGTPAYMSPEQATGEAGRVGSASDVYSLGATLYHLLTGRPPFEGHGQSIAAP